MASDISTIRDETIRIFNEKIIEGTTQEEIKKIVKQTFLAAFANQEDKGKLYKEFSKEFHPDKLKKLHENLYLVVEPLNLEDIFQLELSAYQTKNPLQEMLNGSDSFEKIADFLVSVGKKLNREYPHPLNYLTTPIVAVLAIAFLISFILAYMLVAILSSPFRAILNLIEKIQLRFNNTVSDGIYGKDFDLYVSKESRLFFARHRFSLVKNTEEYFRTVRNETIEEFDERSSFSSNAASLLEERERIQAMDEIAFEERIKSETEFFTIMDDEALELYLIREKGESEKSIRNQNSPRGSTKISMLLRAGWQAIMKPLPDGPISQLASVGSRMLKGLGLIPLVFLTCSIELVQYSLDVFCLLPLGALVLIGATSIIILNSPLYLWDAIQYLCGSSNENVPPPGSEPVPVQVVVPEVAPALAALKSTPSPSNSSEPVFVPQYSELFPPVIEQSGVTGGQSLTEGVQSLRPGPFNADGLD